MAAGRNGFLYWIAGAFGVLLVLTFLFCWEELAGSPNYNSMDLDELLTHLIPIALLANGWFFWIALVIVLFIRKSLSWPVLLVIVPAGIIQAILTIDAVAMAETLQIHTR